MWNLIETIIDFKKNKKVNLKKLRDDLSYKTLSIMSLGTTAIFPAQILTTHPFYNKAIEELKNTQIKIEKDFEPIIDSILEFMKKYSIDYLSDTDPLSYRYTSLQRDFLSRHIKEELKCTHNLAELVCDYLVDIETMSYIPRFIERYSYVSNKNATMHLDLFAFSSAERLYKGLSGKIFYNKRNFKIRASDKINSRKLTEILNKVIYSQNIEIPERISLGSSWVPPKRKEKISKKDAIELLKGGCSPSEISECYRGFTPKQLGAFKDHYITMGKNLVN